MKKAIISLLSLFSVLTLSAQDIVVGDMDGDGKVTIGDVTECANTVIGKSAVKTISAKTLVDPNAPDYAVLRGTWRSITGTKISFQEDGTATHSDLQTVKTYEYYPYARMLVLLNSGNYVVEVFDVIRITDQFLVMCEHGTKTYVCYYADASFVSGITLSQTSLALNTGTSKTLTAVASPPNAIIPLLAWKSSDTSVATVDQNGKVTAVGSGSCVITATATDGTGMSADCSVTVTQLVTGITLSETTLSLDIEGYTKLTATIIPSSVSNASLTWSSSDESVAEVTNKGIVSANAYGKCTITCTANDGSGVSATCTVVVEKPIDYNGHEYVDLGLPSGLKWATCNVGANNPEDYGYYYAWGATKPQDVYDWVHCPFQTQNTTSNSSTKFTKYLGSTSSSYKDPSATDADALKTVLDPEDDAAHVNWGGDWRMPTLEEQYELYSNCYWKWVTSYNGKSVNGYIVYKVKDSADKGKSSRSYSPVGSYSVSDPHIFLPAADIRVSSNLLSDDSYGGYWSSSLYLSSPNYAYCRGFDSIHVYSNYYNRDNGRTVRAVCP